MGQREFRHYIPARQSTDNGALGTLKKMLWLLPPCTRAGHHSDSHSTDLTVASEAATQAEPVQAQRGF